MLPVKTPVYHAPVGKRDSLHPRVGQLGNLHMLGSGWAEAPRWVHWVCYSAIRQEQGLSAPCPTLRCQGYTYSTQPFSSSDPGPPPDVKDNSRTRMHAACSVASVVSNSVILWIIACQAPQSMGLSRQECWSGLPRPPPGDLPDPGIETRSPALQVDSQPPAKPSRTCSTP